MIPSLDELILRLRRDVPHRDSMYELARQVAGCERGTDGLPVNTVRFAFQCLVVLLKHVENDPKNPEN